LERHPTFMKETRDAAIHPKTVDITKQATFDSDLLSQVKKSLVICSNPVYEIDKRKTRCLEADCPWPLRP